MIYSIERKHLQAILELKERGLEIKWNEDNEGGITIDIVPEIAFLVGEACGIRSAQNDVLEILKSGTR